MPIQRRRRFMATENLTDRDLALLEQYLLHARRKKAIGEEIAKADFFSWAKTILGTALSATFLINKIEAAWEWVMEVMSS